MELTFISIVSRWSAEPVLYRGEHATVREALEVAVAAGANLRGANLRNTNLADADLSNANLRDAEVSGASLRGASLRGANLRNANLADANLSGADLRGASLSGANLSGANLSGANLRNANLADADLSNADLRGAGLRGARLTDANLTDANLAGANLTDANLAGADLTDADLTDADLTDANLTDANLTEIRNAVPSLAFAKADMWSIFDIVPHEVPAVRVALCSGKVDGSTYNGSCACLVGTIANARGCSEYDVPGIKPNADRPAEQFFMRIRPGHVPAVNYHAALAVLWIDEWTANRAASTSLEEVKSVLQNVCDITSCPDPGEGGCIGGPIRGYGCVREAVGYVLRALGG